MPVAPETPAAGLETPGTLELAARRDATAPAAAGGGGDRPASVAPDAAVVAVVAADGAADGAADASPAKPAVHPDDVIKAPKMSLPAIFLLFLKFGIRAFGGPIAQINMMREELVVEGQWITPTKFTRVYAVYQILPGPEATELACYFGLLAGGRLGSIVAGAGFITPGFLLMLLAAYLHTTFGGDDPTFRAIFSAIQPAVCAMVVRAAHKIGDSGCRSPATKQLDWRLLILAAGAAFESVLRVNYFITKVHLALLYLALIRKRWVVSAFVAVAPLAAFIAVIAVLGPFTDFVPMGVGAARDLGNTYAAHFVVGLLGGLVTFGGAYTAVPFMQYEAVTDGKWVSNQVFLDSLAICALLPTPLVMFSTMVGYAAGGIVAAVLMTLGMFLPAFSFTVIGHSVFESLTTKKGVVSQVLDSMTASVAGMVSITALTLMRTSITRPLDAIIFLAALHVSYNLKHPYTPVFIVLAAAMAGEILFA
jgi:chromate transporter